MKDCRLQRTLWLIAAALFAALLTTGWLQFRFIEELHSAESGHRRASLEAGLEAFREAFDAEVLGWQLRVQAAARAIDESAQGPRIADEDLWAMKGSDLLAELWTGAYFRGSGDAAPWWPLPGTGSPADSWSSAAATLESADLLHARLDQVLETQTATPVVFGESLAFLVQFGDPQLNELHRGRSAAVITPKSLVILLDRDLFRDRFLSPLIHRHLPYAGGSFDYLIGTGPAGGAWTTLYASSPELDWQDLQPADAEVELLSPKSQAAALLNRSRNRTASAPSPCSENGEQGESCADQVEAGCFAQNDAGSIDPSVIFIRTSEEAGWKLAARSRSGSLEATIDGLRRRNLITSLLSLTVLAACLALLGVVALRAERLARSQLAFVAGVSHDLRTPLSVIQQAAANLADGVVQEKEAVRGYGDLVRREVRRLQEMIERILTFSGLGTQRLPLAAVDLEPLVDRVLDQMSVDIAEKDIEVIKDLPHSLPSVRANEAALESALQNLVSNALKYGSSGGRVCIDASLEEHRGEKEIRLGVRDWGLGVEPADRRHLFEPFFRGRRAREGRQPGTGLGLSLVARVAETLGGSLRFEAPESGGSAFHLFLPAELPAELEP